MRDKGFDFPSAFHCSTNFLPGSRKENNCILYRKLIGNTHPITRGKNIFGVDNGGNVGRGSDVDNNTLGGTYINLSIPRHHLA